MPAFCTHYLFCDDMLKGFDNLDFNMNEKACAIGAQGPDIFFFHRFLPLIMPGRAQRKLAGAIHKCKPAELFDAFADYCAFSPNIDVARSYIYGFVMHYALDRRCHPFVYSYQQRILDQSKYLHSSAAHNRVEHSMDTYMLNLKLGIVDPSDFDCASTFTMDYDVLDEIAHLMAFVIPRATGYSVSEKDVKLAIKDTITMQKILRNKGNRFMRFTKLLDAILGPFIKYYKFSSNINPKDLENTKKYGNIDNRVWYSPYQADVARYESYVDLYEDAKSDCSDLIAGFEQITKGYSTGRDVTHNISFLTGVEV